MIIRALCVSWLLALTVGCVSTPRTEVIAAPEPVAADITTPLVQAFDPATLAALDSLLERLQKQSAVVAELMRSERTYALFRQLEANQARLAAVMAETDAEGRTLYDRLSRMTTGADSLFRLLERLNRRPLRP